MTGPFEEALPEIPFSDWEMVQSGFYENDGAVYYFENQYWQLRADTVNGQIVFKERGHKNGVQVYVDEPVVTRAYGIMLNINSCYEEALKRSA